MNSSFWHLVHSQHDESNEGFKHWEFMTVHCWGERAAGEWTLEIQDKPYHVRNPDVQGKRVREFAAFFFFFYTAAGFTLRAKP